MLSPRLPRDQIPAYLRAIDHNERVALEQHASGKFTYFDYYFVDIQNGRYVLLPPGRRNAELARAYNDYFPGGLIRALPFASRHGSDGIKVSNTGVITPVELKLCIKVGNRYTVNDKGFITVAGSKAVKGIKSDCKACYEISKNLHGKGIDTYFMLYEGDEHEVITIWKVPGSAIVDRLGKNLPKEGEKAKKMNISLSFIMKEGEEVFLSSLDSLGFDAWEDRIYKKAGKSRPTKSEPRTRATPTRSNAKWTKSMEDQLILLADKGLSYSDLAGAFKVSRSSISNKLRRARLAHNQ